MTIQYEFHMPELSNAIVIKKNNENEKNICAILC